MSQTGGQVCALTPERQQETHKCLCSSVDVFNEMVEQIQKKKCSGFIWKMEFLACVNHTFKQVAKWCIKFCWWSSSSSSSVQLSAHGQKTSGLGCFLFVFVLLRLCCFSPVPLWIVCPLGCLYRCVRELMGVVHGATHSWAWQLLTIHTSKLILVVFVTLLCRLLVALNNASIYFFSSVLSELFPL